MKSEIIENKIKPREKKKGGIEFLTEIWVEKMD